MQHPFFIMGGEGKAEIDRKGHFREQSISDREVFGMKIYFTVTGTQFRYGQDFLEKGMKVKLEKEPDNKYDREAIKVSMKGMGQIGYVANSPRTVVGESWSAGRLYDKIEDKAKGRVLYVLDGAVLCSLETGKKDRTDGGDDAPEGGTKDSVDPESIEAVVPF